MNGPLLDVRDLKKHFAPRTSWALIGPAPVVRAVDGVSFHVAEGETLGLVGESGCGKTTTARLLLRLEQPSGGHIMFAGAPVEAATGARLRQYRTQVQAVFQDPYGSLSPRMRVRDIVAEPIEVAGQFSRKQVDERVQELMALVGLSPRMGSRYPHEFSGGQRQRIAIARGLALQPRLIVLDEPVSALDVSIRAQILNLLQDLQERLQLSYVLISHDLDVVAHMCTTIAVMYLGKIVEMGPSKRIRDAPQHPYTQALFSARLPAHPSGQRQRIRLSGEVPSPFDPPSGCRFHTRCPMVMPICRQVEPPFAAAAGGGGVACHLAPAALQQGQRGEAVLSD